MKISITLEVNGAANTIFVFRASHHNYCVHMCHQSFQPIYYEFCTKCKVALTATFCLGSHLSPVQSEILSFSFSVLISVQETFPELFHPDITRRKINVLIVY